MHQFVIIRDVVFRFSKSGCVAFFLIFLVFPASSQPIIKTIKISIIQPFAIGASTGSTRYISNFESAIYYALGKNEEKINACGAKYLVDFKYFPANSLIEARALAKSVDKSDYWLVIGPTGSKHFIAVAKNIKSTLLISLSSLVKSETHRIISTSKNVNDLATTLATKIGSEGKVKNYGVLVDISCLECITFEKIFSQVIENFSINRVFKLDSNDFEYQSNLSELFKTLNTYKKVDALLIPNYSKLSGYIMSQIHPKYPNIIFMGGDGWGQGDWSYLSQFKLPESLEAYSTRGYLPLYKNIIVNSLDIISDANIISPSDLSLSAIYFFDEITDIICHQKITSRNELLKFILSNGNDFLNKKSTIGFYKLRAGKLELDGKKP